MLYVKFDFSGNTTIYEFERRAEVINGTPVWINCVVLSETGIASKLLPERGIILSATDAESVTFSNVEHNIEGWCGYYNEGFCGTTTISNYKLNDMFPAKKTTRKFTVEAEPFGVYRFNPPLAELMEGGE